ncbi:O-antigen ligase family protein [Vibrio rumoiensis]|uniref:O-antigen ligase family protein n=1 Tax=Vibrio rumoiensis TaxID=76258 RepID=UPI003AA9979E
MNPNIYAPIFGLFLLFFINSNIDNLNIYKLILTIVSLYSIIIMQSRGVIISSIISSTYIIIHILISRITRIKFSFKKATFIIIGTCLLASLTINITYNLYNKTAIEYASITEGHLNTSIGQRIQMLLIAKDLIADKPIIGHGSDFKQQKDRIIIKNNYSKSIKSYKTLHNVYTDSWAKLGILGLLVAIYLTLLPYLILRKTNKYYFGITLSIFTLLVSIVDTALLGGEYLLVLLCISYIYKLNQNKIIK